MEEKEKYDFVVSRAVMQMGDFGEAKHQAEHYLHLVPDDVEMQELYDSL